MSATTDDEGSVHVHLIDKTRVGREHRDLLGGAAELQRTCVLSQRDLIAMRVQAKRTVAVLAAECLERRRDGAAWVRQHAALFERRAGLIFRHPELGEWVDHHVAI